MDAVLNTLSKVKLSRGRHQTLDDGMCVMECVAYVAGHPHSDKPACACEVAARIAAYANDTVLPELEEQLARRVLALANSTVRLEQTRARAYYVADQVIRVALTSALAPRVPELGPTLRALPVLDGDTKLEDVLKLCHQLDLMTPSASFDGRLTKRMALVVTALRMSWFSAAAYEAMLVLRYARAKVDLIELLDGILAIGARPALRPTEEVKERIAQLMALTE